MLHCPKCNSEINQKGKVCSICGHEYQSIEPPQGRQRPTIAPSKFNDAALVFSEAVCGLFSIACILLSLVLMFRGEVLKGLLFCPVTATMAWAMFVVFRRVRKM
jgi:hypothetical protein